MAQAAAMARVVLCHSTIVSSVKNGESLRYDVAISIAVHLLAGLCHSLLEQAVRWLGEFGEDLES